MKQSKWALILGGSGSLGYASALKLAQHGWNIYLIYRERKSKLDEVAAQIDELKALGIDVIAVNADALNADQIEVETDQLFTQIGSGNIHLVLHAIAKGNLKPLVRGETHSTKSDFEITLYAMAYNLVDWINACRDKSLLNNEASIIGLDSEGSVRSIPNYAVVGAAKSALVKLLEELAVELGPIGMRCNIIRAGVVDTPALRLIPDADQIIEEAKKRNPRGRITTPEDVANAVYLLSLKESHWINGSVIKVDGGEGLV